MNFLFDFDGTIVDSKVRQYTLFSKLIETQKISFEDYWNIKRRKINQERMLTEYLNYTGAQILNFKRKWLSLIEDPDLLALDTLYPNAHQVLSKCSSIGSVYLVTARQDQNLVLEQLESFGIKKYFKDVLVTKQIISKDSIVKKCIITSINDFFIGDTGEDINAGKSLAIKTIAITHGVLSYEALLPYGADHMAHDLNAVLDIFVKYHSRSEWIE